MKNAEVSRQHAKLTSAIKKAAASTTDLELHAYWARYFCVIAAGFIENALKELLGDHIRRRSTGAVRKYANGMVLRLQNPNTEKIVQLIANFDDSWAVDIKTFAETNGGKDAIDAIMRHRHSICHGKDSLITIVSLQGYIAKTLDVLERLETHTDP